MCIKGRRAFLDGDSNHHGCLSPSSIVIKLSIGYLLSCFVTPVLSVPVRYPCSVPRLLTAQLIKYDNDWRTGGKNESQIGNLIISLDVWGVFFY